LLVRLRHSLMHAYAVLAVLFLKEFYKIILKST
jgi:hypothetical protein